MKKSQCKEEQIFATLKKREAAKTAKLCPGAWAGPLDRGARGRSGAHSAWPAGQNGHVENFHGRLPDDCLDAHGLCTVNDVWNTVASWRQEDDCERRIVRMVDPRL